MVPATAPAAITRAHRTRVRPMGGMMAERAFDVKVESNICLKRPRLPASFQRGGGAMEEMTARQRRILDFIHQTVRTRGYPPTVREIGEAVGLTSSSSVHAQLANLERRGLLRRDPTKPRAMELQGRRSPGRRGVAVPLVGRISAGAPVLADEAIEDVLVLPEDYATEDDHFALRVR